MTQEPDTTLLVTRDPNSASESELVLLAQGLSPSVRRTGDGFVLSVPEHQLEKARASLAAYERENQTRAPRDDEPFGSAGLPAGGALAGALLVFFFVTVRWNAVPWFERGSADAERIALGESWRAVTALTLHADLMHALTNAVAGALFFGAVSGILGPGLGFALVLLAGAGGNLINALLHGSSHVAVGASTSVFGAVGLLGGLALARRRRGTARTRRAWLPIAAALALLGMLGTGGPRVDVWAHLLGLSIGGVLGFFAQSMIPRRPACGAQWGCGIAALTALIACWTLALR